MAFFNSWILALAVLAIPICAVRGRNVENMKVLQFMLLHIKYLYGIKIDVKGWENFPLKEPYVVVSNHQSSIDLLGMMEVLPSRCVPIAKRELMYAGTAGLACWLAGVIFINRKKTDDAISVMSETAQTMLKEDVPIIPVVMSSYKDFYNIKENKFTTGTCVVRILPKINTKGLTSDDVADLADRTRQTMLSTFLQLSSTPCPASGERVGRTPCSAERETHDLQ
ncbi:PLCA acyltransferase, partial [Polyodon spathula]|nr:PLCA acyltransferase [Polyodon spathula]